ncbi:MAG: SDR family NAD(P)-dependent oxidoreductase, partial [Vulcanimicrobiaceae bacterium]
LLEAGATVVINGRDQERLQRATEELGQSLEERSRIVPISADVRSSEQVEGMMQEIRTRCGRLDILVNNVGVNNPTMFDELSFDNWHAEIDLNLNSVFLCCSKSLPLLRAQGGAVINMASIGAFYAHPGRSGYAAAKAGVVSLTKTLAYEWAPLGIRVNCIAPGAIVTEGSRFSKEAVRTAVERHVPVGRLGTPREIAACALFLVSTEASYITGSIIVIDGGPHKAVLGNLDELL